MAEGHHEIIIVRRHGHGDHDDHHGGVWKIAFADFMTAMMAFFLVMWLISANEKTRASVARYFNPVKLVDATTQPRGLHDSKKDESGVTASADTKAAEGKPDKAKGTPGPAAAAPKAETPAAREQRLDKTLLENPYAALAEIAAAKGPGDAAPPAPRPSHAPVLGLRGGEQFRDPFAPPPPGAADDEAIAALREPAPAAERVPPKPRAGADAAKAKAAESKAAAKQETEKAQILATLKDRDAGGPAVDVRRTSEGLLVSLTDTADFAMFSSGSAVPSRRVVLLMERVAQTLKGRPGAIVLRGYTDNKPFRSAHYDNWRLSLDRAQVAHYMLVRGGLADARIGRVEGYADRAARPGLDPASPANRRIEILLKDGTP